MFADLHLHSCFSDGTWTPEQLVEQARLHNLDALGLTDHDTVEGCARMSEACSKHEIAFAPGVEMTTECDGEELHILGYFIDPTSSDLLDQLAKFQAARQQRVREMVARLNDLGISLHLKVVLELANCHSPGRPHVARALVQQGFCSNNEEAFERFLKKHRPAWVPKWKVQTPKGIQLIHQTGGLAVLAHPGLNKADHLIPFLVDAGIDGLECFHPKHSPAMAAHYTAIAKQHGLLITGGSDCHGLNKGKATIGTVRLPHEYFQKLADMARDRKSAPGRHGRENNSDGDLPIANTAIVKQQVGK